MNGLESVQRWVMKSVHELKRKSYEKRPKTLDPYDLGYRRLRNDHVMTFSKLKTTRYPLKYQV